MEEITQIQENLLLLRRTVGWTAEKFGEKIGVTRQTINNIENSQLKWMLIENSELRNQYVRGEINEELHSIIAESGKTFDKFSSEYTVVFH